MVRQYIINTSNYKRFCLWYAMAVHFYRYGIDRGAVALCTRARPVFLWEPFANDCENDREMNRSAAVMLRSSITILSITKTAIVSHSHVQIHVKHSLRLSCSFTAVICVRCESTNKWYGRGWCNYTILVWYTRFSKLNTKLRFDAGVDCNMSLLLLFVRC